MIDRLRSRAMDRPSLVIALALIAAVVVAFSDSYWTYVVGVILIMGLFAASLDLLVGYGGLLAFAHGTFLGIGGYTVAILCIDHGVPFALALVVSVASSAAVAAVIGAIGARLREIQFAIVMLAIGQLAWMLVFQSRSISGGDDGKAVARSAVLPEWLSESGAFLVLTTVVALSGFVLLRIVAASKFGMLLSATREQERRLPFMGYSVVRVRVTAFVVSGVVASISGTLLALHSQFIDPSNIYWSTTGTALVSLLVGGSRTISGAFVGTALYLLLEEKLSSVTENWMLLLGLVLILVVMFFPDGVLGLFRTASRRWHEKSSDRGAHSVEAKVVAK